MRVRLDQIVVDSHGPSSSVVRFWAALLGGDSVDRARGWFHVEPPGFPRLSFQPVPRWTLLHSDVLAEAELLA
jgi:hypothetical protein